MKGIGSWMVEIFANGKRCSALIHKGEVHHAIRDTGNGLEMLLSDYDGTPLKGAEVILRNKTYLSDERGQIKLPYSPIHTNTPAILHLPSKDRKMESQKSSTSNVVSSISRSKSQQSATQSNGSQTTQPAYTSNLTF
ncbi:hypothetical protein [Rubritalea tangerina]|uniref:hypothetical protein n=1 Tax=Rubritalea tangerina TaxID=430798 RepID=UPI003608C8D8